MSKIKDKNIKAYMAEIGSRGGSVTSVAKKKATAKSLEKARLALKKKREKK